MSNEELVFPRIRGISASLLVLTSVLFTGCQSIHTAARESNLKEVKRQLAWGANPNSRDWFTVETPLIEAAANGHADVVKLLIQSGADVNLQGEAWYGPLHRACENGHVEVAKILLENGADVNLFHHHRPIHYAVMNGNTELAEILFAYGADVSAKGNDGATPLHIAVSDRQLEMVRWLLSKGADVNARAGSDLTPLHWAAGRNNVTVGRLLLEHGADPTGVSKEFLRSCYNR